MAAGKARRSAISNVGRGGRKVASLERKGIAGSLSHQGIGNHAERIAAGIKGENRNFPVEMSKLIRKLEQILGADFSSPQYLKRLAAYRRAYADAFWKDALAYGTGVAKIKDGVVTRIPLARFRRRVHAGKRVKGK